MGSGGSGGDSKRTINKNDTVAYLQQMAGEVLLQELVLYQPLEVCKKVKMKSFDQDNEVSQYCTPSSTSGSGRKSQRSSFASRSLASSLSSSGAGFDCFRGFRCLRNLKSC